MKLKKLSPKWTCVTKNIVPISTSVKLRRKPSSFLNPIRSLPFRLIYEMISSVFVHKVLESVYS